MRTYPHGVPCWIDTEAPDADAAARFYGELFGWTFEYSGAPGSYLMASLGGQDVAAVTRGAGDAARNTNDPESARGSATTAVKRIAFSGVR